MKKIVTLFAALFSLAAVFAAPTITDVTAMPHNPWDGKVDVSYTVNGDIAAHCNEYGLIPALKVTATDKAVNRTYTATKLSGDTNLTAGAHKIVWDMDAQGLSFKSANVVFNVACETTEAQYCVIDLSAGANATSYPVTYLASEPSGGFNVDTYKTTKMVLKRIAAGSFIMGDNQKDEAHRVKLTKPFLMGLFEMTQKQYSLVMGANPATGNGVGDSKPVYAVSYITLRGSSNGINWPASSSVDASSFMGKLQSKTALNFDLPTEAQWEYACRAGSSTAYSYGNEVNGDYMWYYGNSNYNMSVHDVGTKEPNPWGLYDMHGNVSEWCLDRYIDNLAYGLDPTGGTSGTSRVNRGGGSASVSTECTSASRLRDSQESSYIRLGFRLSMTLKSDFTECAGLSTAVPIGLSETHSTEVPVTYEWLNKYFPSIGGSWVEYEEMAMKTAANGHKVWECYVAGEDPTDATSKFVASIVVGEDGKPFISWNPDLGAERSYTILGSTDLKTWAEVSKGEEVIYNFFKVLVEMK